MRAPPPGPPPPASRLLPLVVAAALCSLTFYGLHQTAGLTGILLFRVLFAVAIVGALHRLALRRGAGLRPTAVLVAAATVALTPALIGERPWLVSILFCTLTLDAVL